MAALYMLSDFMDYKYKEKEQRNRASGLNLVVTGETVVTRGGGMKQPTVEELAANVNSFLEQMGNILEKTPEKVGKFHFDEFHVSAQITAKGSLAILGTGGEVGATGGLMFVFRRSSS